MDGCTDDGRKVITIAHFEHSSGEPKIHDSWSEDLSKYEVSKNGNLNFALI